MALKILIADDDRVISGLVAAVVRQAGHTPLHAYDAMQTVMFAMRTPAPDLIILDINMPGGTAAPSRTARWSRCLQVCCKA